MQNKINEQALRLMNYKTTGHSDGRVKQLELRLSEREQSLAALQERNVELSRALADYNSCLTKINKMEGQLDKEKTV